MEVIQLYVDAQDTEQVNDCQATHEQEMGNAVVFHRA
jgi:hypothetical protein